MERRVVDPNSVQTQFATLNRDRDAFRNAAKTADHQRINEEKLLRNLRSAQAELLENLRFAHSKLGEEDKKRKMLREKEIRLNSSLREDKNEIIRLTSELDGLEEEEKAQKKMFVKEIDNLNAELDKEIKMHRETLAMKDITVKNLSILLSTKLSEEVTWEQQNQHDDQASTLKWRSLSEKLQQGLDVLQAATNQFRNETENLKDLESEKHDLRNKMITSGQAKDEPLGDMELDELERLWEEAYQLETIGGSKNGTDHNNCNEHGEDHHVPQGQEHINMSLFYGNQDPISMEY